MRTLARASDNADILRRLRSVRPDSVARWGRMSAHQMVCHLSDALRTAIGQRPVSRADSALSRTFLKWAVLYLPWQWPTGIATRPEIDQEIGGTKPLGFADDVRHLEKLVDSVAAQGGRVDWQAHPIFGRMSEAAWLRFAYLHMDHHLRQFGV